MVDDAITSPENSCYWFKLATLFLFWLYYPRTSGALLIDEYWTQRFIAPYVRPLEKKMLQVIKNIYNTLVNASHLYMMWIFFLILPARFKRFVAVAVGTVYPFVASVGAISTEDFEDDSYWLTYWSCYGILFLLMNFFETWLGKLPGFYSLIIFSEAYLMLPMFGGADKIFRDILVPLCRLDEMLLLRDAYLVQKRVYDKLKPERASIVRSAISSFFTSSNVQTNEAGLISAYEKMSTSSASGEPTETTSLV